jgi:hypothetical protein
MNTLYIQKMMGPTVLGILIALYNGLALFGCGLAGIPLTIGDLIDHESK